MYTIYNDIPIMLDDIDNIKCYKGIMEKLFVFREDVMQ